MVIAVASLCFVMDEEDRSVRVALGSVGPTILRASDAEAYCTRVLTEAGAWEDPLVPLRPQILEDFGARVANAARPIDDVRGTAAYRRHACAILARRALSWAMQDRQQSPDQAHGGPH